MQNFLDQLALIFNKLEALLSWILCIGRVFNEKEVVESYFNTFMSAFNLFYHIFKEHAICEWEKPMVMAFLSIWKSPCLAEVI